MSVVQLTDVQVIEPTGGYTLTLVTDFPFYHVGTAPNLFIVSARDRTPDTNRVASHIVERQCAIGQPRVPAAP
ncbi:MAG TPA: hypothetical protein VLV86_13115 [Vicinamibacterales bacterium]|nr:hypothetical protein [Vicinamibacterales bacterium]